MTLAEQRKRLVKATQFVSGGLLNDVDVEIIDAKFMYFDYDGQGPEVCASQFTLRDSEGEEHIQHWPVGGHTQDGDNLFAPSDDGKFVYRMKEKGSLNRGSNHFLMIDTLKRCGLPDESDVDNDIALLIGTKGHVLRYPAPKRNMPNQKKREDGREPEFLGWSEVYSFPWDGKGKGKGSRKAQGASKGSGGAAGAGKANGSAAGVEDAGDTLEAQAEAMIREALSEAKGSELDLTELTMAVFGAAGTNGVPKSDRKQIMTLAGDVEFLAGLEGVEVDGDTVSLAG